ncbi:MAG: AarF/ABC1/UbiB kinase family protein [Patescibacteria group bacterium]
MKTIHRIARLKKVMGIALLIAKAKLKNKQLPKGKVLESVLDLGGVYVKFIQILAVRSINVTSWDGHEIKSISKIYDQVEIENIDIDKLLSSELGDWTQRIRYIESQPFASGSFGQVYRAELKDGTKLAIKVVRPSVVNNIEFDLKVLGFFIRLAGLFNKSGFDLRKIYKQFAEVTRRELDYEQEVKYGDLLYHRYKNHHSIVIPKTYLELSNKHVITQEFIDGISATKLFDVKEQGLDPVAYIKDELGSDLIFQLMALGRDQLDSLLTDGSSHGDPHPGNIVLMTNNKIALLDFGIQAHSPDDRKAFFGLVKEYQKIYAGKFDFENYIIALMNLFVSELLSAVSTLDTYSRGAVSDQMLSAIKATVESIYQGSTREMAHLLERQKHLLIFTSVINQNNRFSLNFEIEQPEFLRATNLYLNLVEALGLKQVVLSSVYTDIVMKYEDVQLPTKTRNTTPDQAVEVISHWLDDIASRDIYLFNMLASKIRKGALNA